MSTYTIEPVVDSQLYTVDEIRRLYDLFDVTSVHQVQNPILWGLYKLRKSEMELNNLMVHEFFLYHVTATKNVQSIVENNLNWRFTTRCRFGKGVCFSYCPLYANKYASCSTFQSFEVEYDDNLMNILLKMGFPKEAIKRALYYTYNESLEIATKWLMDHITDYDFAEPFIPTKYDLNKGVPIDRAFIICRVLVQRIKEFKECYGLNILPNFYDTGKSKNGMVYVKFNDFEFYPQYIVYFKEHNYYSRDIHSYNGNYNYDGQ